LAVALAREIDENDIFNSSRHLLSVHRARCLYTFSLTLSPHAFDHSLTVTVGQEGSWNRSPHVLCGEHLWRWYILEFTTFLSRRTFIEHVEFISLVWRSPCVWSYSYGELGLGRFLKSFTACFVRWTFIKMIYFRIHDISFAVNVHWAREIYKFSLTVSLCRIILLRWICIRTVPRMVREIFSVVNVDRTFIYGEHSPNVCCLYVQIDALPSWWLWSFLSNVRYFLHWKWMKNVTFTFSIWCSPDWAIFTFDRTLAITVHQNGTFWQFGSRRFFRGEHSSNTRPFQVQFDALIAFDRTLTVSLDHDDFLIWFASYFP
jgi:hypothetical protein